MSNLKPVLLKFILISCVLLMQGCTFMKLVEHGTMQPPTLSFIDYEITDVTMDAVNINLYLTADNPNQFEIDTFFVDYQIYLKEQGVAEGCAVNMNFIPDGVGGVTLPMVVIYEHLYETVGALAELISENKKSVDTKVDIIIYGEYFIVKTPSKTYTKFFNYQHSVNMDVPLPEITLDSVGKMVSEKLDSFFE